MRTEAVAKVAFFQQITNGGGEARCRSAIEHAMIVCDGDLHYRPHHWGARDRDHLLFDCSGEHDRGLWGDYHGRSSLDSVCTQIRNRKSAAFDISDSQLFKPRAAGNIG